jgi:hypothetical protein
MGNHCECTSVATEPNFEDIAKVYLWACEHEIEPEVVDRQVRLAEFCRRFGQFRYFYDDKGELCGFGEWLRLEMEHLPVLERMQEDEGWLELTEDEIRNGPVLYWANAFTIRRGVAWKVAKELAQLPGVTHCAGWRKGRLHISPVKEVLSCRSLRQWLSQT